MPTATQDIQGAIQQFRTTGSIFDFFDRANSAVTLDTSSSGHTWVVETGGAFVYGISEQEAYAVSGASATGGFVFQANQADLLLIECRLQVSSLWTAGIIFRSDGAFTSGNKWIARLTVASGMGRLEVVRVTAGSATTQATVDVDGLFGEGSFVRLGVHLIGSTLKFFANDVLIHERVDATFQANTRHGIVTNTNGLKVFDNFAVRPLGGNPLLQVRANILNTTPRTVQIRAAVRNTVTQTQSMRADITGQVLQTVQMRASLLAHVHIRDVAGEVMTEASPTRITYEGAGFASVLRTVPNNGEVLIWQLDTQFFSGHIVKFSARANIRNRVEKTLSMRALVTDREFRQLSMRASILPRFSKTIRMRAKIQGPITKTISIRSNIRNRVSRAINMRASISRIHFDLQIQARINVVELQTTSMRAKMTDQILAKLDMRANIANRVDRTIQLRARVQPVTFLSMRAQVANAISTTLEVFWNTAEPLRTPLLVSWSAGGMSRASAVISMKARILSPRSATVQVTWRAPQSLPEPPIILPSQRITEP